ncbi:Histone deacetylase [Dirofilaria immitis]
MQSKRGPPTTSSTPTSSEVNDQVIMHTVVPLRECPHLVEIRELPVEGLDAQASCSECHSSEEQWVCLTCYSVNCSRYVEGHAVHHQMRTGHSMALSLTDLSVWCYPCESTMQSFQILFSESQAAHPSNLAYLEYK